MSDYIAELERELVRAGLEWQRRRARFAVAGGRRVAAWRLPRLSVANVVAVVALVSSMAVAYLALTSLRGGNVAQPIPAGAQRLASTLSVLRRPQTDADRGLDYRGITEFSDGLPDGDFVRSLTRLVVRAQDLNLYVVVQRPTAWPNQDGLLWSPTLGDRVGLYFVGTISGVMGFYKPVPAADLYRHVLMFDSSGLTLPNGYKSNPGYGFELVPDRVSRVVWVVRVRGGQGGMSLITVIPTIRNNVAFAKLPPRVAADPNPDLRHDTWYDRAGRVIPDRTAPLRAAATATARFYRPAQAVLGAFSVFRRPKATLTEAGITISELPGAGGGPQFRGAESRSVATRSGAHFSIIPTRLGACILPQSGPNGGLFGALGASVDSCSTSVAAFLRRGIWKVTGFAYSVGDFRGIYGVVPDTNHSITLELRNGGTRTVQVVDGVFVADVRGVTAIRIRSASGRLATWPVSSPW